MPFVETFSIHGPLTIRLSISSAPVRLIFIEETRMKMCNAARFLMVVSVVSVFPALASTQDFLRSYPIAEGGFITISDISANVKVVGFGGREIEVVGLRPGRHSGRIEIEDRKDGNRLELSEGH